MSNCLFESAYEETLRVCNCTPSFHQVAMREFPWIRICTGTKLKCMKKIFHGIGNYKLVSSPPKKVEILIWIQSNVRKLDELKRLRRCTDFIPDYCIVFSTRLSSMLAWIQIRWNPFSSLLLLYLCPSLASV